MSVSSSFSSSSKFKYDVFLTLRDPEGRLKSYLENIFRDAGITAFIDEAEGKRVPLEKVAFGSKVVIVLFTPEFVESEKYLKRLAMRTKWWNKSVVPVFYGVSREQVHQKIMALPYNVDLAGIASLPGFKLSIDSGNKISSHMANLGLSILRDRSFHDLPRHLVGLALCVRDLLNVLGLKYILSDETITVGIWGEGGIGKTTIAKAIYDRIGGNFLGKSFLSNIGDVWEKDHGEVLLMKQLISDISENELDETNVFMHKQMKQVLCGKRVLVVLDDVNSEFQLEELCRYVKWCGKGSLIFITSRNKAIFEDFIDISYEMTRLSEEESLQLFCLHAFKKFNPTNDFEDFSERISGYCEELPLVLEVFGSLLHNRTKEQWETIMHSLVGIPRGQIQKKLKIICDLLTDIEKDLFFNIASFHVGQSKHFVTQLLKSSGVPMEMGIASIIERNLVKVMNDKLYVHDLLQEIARDISPNKPKLKYIYDVFLSFRGDDTRKTFTSHLCAALKQAGIKVYMDEDRIEKGENISSSLLEAIESSRISVIVFSKNYADSSWCLQELKKIMECYKTTYQEVLPIFFDVRPFEVRKQQNAFGKAWQRYIKRSTSSSKMEKWTENIRRVLKEVANLSGWDMHKYSTETKLIDEVIETITKKLGDSNCLFVAHHPVGLEPRMQDILQLLQSKSNDVIISGIWGMGGIGKTTIAKAVYNHVGQSFDGKCFLANVREVWKQANGQVQLQEQLLSDILKARRVALPNAEMGKTLLKKTLCEKRVLVVLDDVDNEDQLKALCGSREWFGQGSRIIVTTRDQRLLKILRVIQIHTLEELDNKESLELFSWHAFKQAIPEQDFIDFSRRVVSYTEGLPLALEILGSYLFDRERSIWESVLEKLQEIPNGQIQEKLKISYDGLSDTDKVKEIFLDICCFFVGKDKSFTTQILNGCRFYAVDGINLLIERSLIRVDEKYKLEMHDLLRDMGREIIRKESPEEPENRTRLWCYDDVLDVLRTETGTKSIKGLALLSRNNPVSLSARTFEKMKKLRILQLDNVQLNGDYGYLSTNLRWLCWTRFPLENLPMNFNLEKIIAIDLKWSNLVKVWERSQLLKELKILNLSHSLYLTKTPDFSKMPNLEMLKLKDCPSLSIIHPSIGDLKYTVSLNLKGCKSLTHLPSSVYNLKSLKTLNLFGCSKIERLEEDIAKMESLTTLVTSETAIAQVPFSLVGLKSIKHLSICGYEGSPCDVFPYLILPWMSPTHHPKSLSRAFRILPSLFRGISHNIFSRRFEIKKARTSTSQASCQSPSALLEFHEQIHVEMSETLMTSLTIQVGWFNKTMDTILKSISKGWNDGGLDFSPPTGNSPDWQVFVNEGSSVSFKVPQVVGRSLKGVVFYVIYSSLQDSTASVYSVGIMINNFTKATMDFYKREVAATTSDNEEWQNIVSNLDPGSEVEVEIKLGHKYMVVKKTAIYLVYVEAKKMITSE